ncbi:hypothetical protein [Methylobacterium sp. Leaf113]|uniref:hypothetical protein n=1 Tax=unclassified Methylobacterium TaxID=2615210 RepID=UPI0006F9FC8B|nr:hypothetical protein [Methylobacterium sp. Leaf113]KQP92418.1 hypothetical protein ASF60_17240 [Methylobacterium sp. Leaf113]MCK2055168.1 hypothetical protein [Methylobacterium sp. 37f]
MPLLMTLLWPVLVASALLGAAVGWLTGLPRTPMARGIAVVLVAVVAAAAGIAVFGLVPGRAGFWVESAALALAAYLIGTTLVAAVLHGSGERP